jgi:hypothetical protein
MSDVVATTPSAGAAVPEIGGEDHFQSLWSSGAFDPNGVPPTDEERRDIAPQNQGNEAQAKQREAGSEDHPDGQQTQTEESEPEFQSLDDLLTSLKVDPQSVRNLNITTVIDGKTEQVPLEKIIASYQLQGHVNNKSVELSNDRSAFEKARNDWHAQNAQIIQQHQQMANVAMQMLNQDFARVDWNALRTQNPAEFAALSQEYQNRQSQIQGYMQQLQQQAQQSSQQWQAERQAALAQEQQKMLEAVPEWRTPETYQKDMQQIGQYARSLGFNDAELGQIADHRYMRVLRDAAQYRALQAAKPEALKKVRQAPPQAAPGSRTNANPNESRRAAAIDRFNRNPNDEDAQAAVFSLFTD